MNIENVLDALKDYGLTEYESKIYVSLLQQHPANGNMISLSSGVPTSKVYGTLRDMERKGYVRVISKGDKQNSKHYRPLPYEELLQNFEVAFKQNYAVLDSELEKISNQSEQDPIELFRIDGYEGCVQVMKEEIDAAQSKILISGWPEDLRMIFSDVMKAHSRGVEVISILFDESELDIPWRTVKHYQVELAETMHQGELNLVLDDAKVVILETKADSSYAIVSSHQSMVKNTRNYIRHDMYVNTIMADFPDEMTEKYGKQLEKLIDRF